MDEFDGIQLEGTTRRGDAKRPGLPVDPFRLKRAVLNGKAHLIAAAIVGVVLGLLYVKLVMVSPYETTVVLKYEGDLDVQGLPVTRDALTPVADALMSQAVLREIREEIGFKGELSALAAAINYSVDLWAGTMKITVRGETGEDAAEFARLVADVFTQYHRERQARRIEQEIARLAKRIAAGEVELEEARQRYNAFREEHGIADLPTEQESMVASAADLRADAELATSEIRALEAQVGSLEAQLANTPKTSVLPDGTSPERAAYDRLRQELASARATLSADHPRVQSLEQQVQHLRSQLRSGGTGPGGPVTASETYNAVQAELRDKKSLLAALRERQKGLADMADKAQQRVGSFSKIEGEATALLAEVTVNENLLAGLERTEAALEDALSDPPSGLVVLDPGAVPEYPVANKMKKVMFVLIIMVFIGLALLFVLRREFGGLRPETPAEIAFWGNGPALGSTSWPLGSEGPHELIAGLDDFAPDARGNFLFVGGTPSDATLARELATRMNRDWFLDEGEVPPARTVSVAPDEQAPLQTPAPPRSYRPSQPSGPYPIGGTGPQSTALVRRPSAPPREPVHLVVRSDRAQLDAWEGPHEGQSLRRAARLADRVVVLVRSGSISIIQLNKTRHRLGRENGIGYIVVGLPEEFNVLADRAGNVAGFWGV